MPPEPICSRILYGPNCVPCDIVMFPGEKTTAGDGGARSLSASASCCHGDIRSGAEYSETAEQRRRPYTMSSMVLFPRRRKRSLMNWNQLSRLVSNVIPAAAILAWVTIGLSSLTQTGLAQ